MSSSAAKDCRTIEGDGRKSFSASYQELKENGEYKGADPFVGSLRVSLRYKSLSLSSLVRAPESLHRRGWLKEFFSALPGAEGSGRRATHDCEARD